MGIYNSAVITNTGQALLAQSVAGNDLKFTTVKTSNYTYPSGTSLADLTTLTGIKQSKNITGATVYNSRVIKVSAMVDNAGVTAEYSINTIGVYATVGTAAEQLFAVITAQEADKMPAFNSRPYSYIYDLNMTMQGASNITVTVNNAGFVNINDLNNALEGINESIESINGDLTTLSEKKLNISDIINNLTSSDTNKPLSAAMGNELNKKVTIQNLTSQITFESIVSSQGDAFLYRIGNICNLQVRVVFNSATTGNTTIARLPVRPQATSSNGHITLAFKLWGTNVETLTAYITPNGELNVSSGASTSGRYLINTTFICQD